VETVFFIPLKRNPIAIFAKSFSSVTRTGQLNGYFIGNIQIQISFQTVYIRGYTLFLYYSTLLYIKYILHSLHDTWVHMLLNFFSYRYYLRLLGIRIYIIYAVYVYIIIYYTCTASIQMYI
jgi:hypothetical protein